MFTGIVQDQLTITAYQAGDPTVVTLTLPSWGKPEIGESILLHGICTTVVSVQADTVTIELMSETLKRSNAGQWQVGQQIHAEPAATLQTKLSGNLVYGHVDVASQVLAVQNDRLTVAIPENFQPFVLEKGSITINGVNLTITAVTPGSCRVELIPHTAKVTSLLHVPVGQTVNLEFDYLTKVIVRSVQQHPAMKSE